MRLRNWKPSLTGVFLVAVVLFGVDAILAGEQAAAKADAAGIEFFEKKIRPVLVAHCYKCHSADSKELKGGLRVDSREGMLQGGENGPAVVPGKTDASLIVESLKYESFEMPPEGKLPDLVIADFEKWIELGAPDPRTAKAQIAGEQNSASLPGADLWSLKPIADPAPPQVQDASWPRTEIDRFVQARREQSGLQIAADADKTTLLRRIYFDLIGLPPTPAQLNAFLADDLPDAFTRVVDELLASPRFGERWGRHWLDVARFGESNGRSRDVLLPHAWRYRNYVIDAFNRDLPYDRFITEQLAGDLLPAESPAERDRLAVATGFLAIGCKTLVGNTVRVDLIDEQIDATSKAFLGLTVSCARCHNHKFDPIPTRDYYALSGIFLSSDTRYGGGLRPGKNEFDRVNQLLVLGDQVDERLTRLRKASKESEALGKQRQQLAKRLKTLQKKLPDDWQARLKELRPEEKPAEDSGKRKRPKPKIKQLLQAAGPNAVNQPAEVSGKKKRPKPKINQLLQVAAPNPEDQPAEEEKDEPDNGSDNAKDRAERQLAQYAQLQDELRQVQARINALEAEQPGDFDFAVGVVEAPKATDDRIHVRGEVKQLGESVPRGFLSCVELAGAPPIGKNESGRMQLARWIANPANPLTARVAVNRIWLHLFGRGLVDSVDNFGTTGERPTHPELLDFLARRFVAGGWSTKSLIREIVLSRTYQLSSAYNADNAARDPDNAFYWRASRKRLEAEALRDAMLAASGQLKMEPPESSVVARMGNGEVGRRINVKLLAEPFPHRSVYLPVIRGIVPEFLSVFDFPEPSNVQGKRDVTTVPTQSLFLMNNPFVIEQAAALADRVLETEQEDHARIELAWQLCYARKPGPEESAGALEFVNRHAERLAKEKTDLKQPRRDAWTSLCQALFAAAEFRYLE